MNRFGRFHTLRNTINLLYVGTNNLRLPVCPSAEFLHMGVKYFKGHGIIDVH